MVRPSPLSLYTILPSPRACGIWHTKGVSVGGRILRNRRAIVLQKGKLYKWGGGGKKRGLGRGAEFWLTAGKRFCKRVSFKGGGGGIK